MDLVEFGGSFDRSDPPWLRAWYCLATVLRPNSHILPAYSTIIIIIIIIITIFIERTNSSKLESEALVSMASLTMKFAWGRVDHGKKLYPQNTILAVTCEK